MKHTKKWIINLLAVIGAGTVIVFVLGFLWDEE